MKPQTNAKVKSVPAGFITEKKRVFKLIDPQESVDAALNKFSNSFKAFFKGILLFVELLFSPQSRKNNLQLAHVKDQQNSIEPYALIIGERYKN